MRKLFKKVMAVSLAAVMTIGTTGVVSARVANGANVASTVDWSSFSVLTYDGTYGDYATGNEEWAKADPTCGTKGYLTGSVTASGWNMHVISTGWDGSWTEDAAGNPVLAADNPWGMDVTGTNIKVEAGRTYTMTFDIDSTLAAGDVTTKYIQCKVYTLDSGDPAITFDSASGCDNTGYMTLVKGKKTSVKAVFTVADDYLKGEIGIKFALGAFLLSHDTEVGLAGDVKVSNFKITANPQYSVTFKNGSKTVNTQWLNSGKTASTYKVTKKGYTFDGWYYNGVKYNFNTKVTKNITLTAKWTKTKAPSKAKIKKVSSNSHKKLTVKLNKTKNAVGYKIQYSTDKKFKKSVKSKTTKKTTYTIKKLKAGKKYYVRVKAYKVDSQNNKVYSKKWSSKKSTWIS